MAACDVACDVEEADRHIIEKSTMSDASKNLKHGGKSCRIFTECAAFAICRPRHGGAVWAMSGLGYEVRHSSYSNQRGFGGIPSS